MSAKKITAAVKTPIVAAAAPADVKTAPAAPPKTSKTLTLRDVCNELKIKPRVARVALRKMQGGTLKANNLDERYTFVAGSERHTAAMDVLRKLA